MVQEDSADNVVSFFIYDGSYIWQENLKDKYLFKTADGTTVTLAANKNKGIFSIICLKEE